VANDPLGSLHAPQLGRIADEVVADAQATAGVPAALYVADLDGRCLRRVAGTAELAGEVETVQLVGPELPARQAAVVGRSLSAAAVLPLVVGQRALTMLAFSRPPSGDLDALATRAAASLELAERYTDVLAIARRHRPCTAAAELQQDLLPPRIARLPGADLAGSILPAYDVGGDWIDHSATPDGGWLGVADAVGKGSQASAIGAIALGAYRAARRGGGDLAAAARRIHETICVLEVAEVYMSAVLAAWDGPSSSLTWLRCGHPPPMVWHAERGLRALDGGDGPVLGLDRLAPPRDPGRAAIGDDELVVLISDGVLERTAPGGEAFGEDGLRRVLDELPEASATAAVSALLHAVGTHFEGPLRDDASVLVLAPD
jgi:serine phosphatase RsbU (regulator of sigma subunit)